MKVIAKPKVSIEKPCKKLDFSKSTSSDFQEIVTGFHETGEIYHMNVEQLVKHFLGKALCKNFFKTKASIRAAYIKTSWEKDKAIVPVDERAFCFYILKQYFGYDNEPKSKLLDSYQRASMHLVEIDERLKKIQEDIKRLSLDSKSTESQEKLPVLHYYSQNNISAREEIITFIKYNIHDVSLGRSHVDIWNLFSHAYSYEWNPKSYEVYYPKIFSNKFKDLGLKEYNDIPDMYTNRKEEFDIFLDNYIKENSVIDTIRSSNGNFVVGKRWKMISQALDAYENGYKILFSSACLQIVEGIFHDICLLLNIQEKDIVGAGFMAKLDSLEKIDRLDINYEYYKFKFRLLRNQVAHGIADADELEDISGLLLLDLLDVINISNSSKIYSNTKRFFLHQALLDNAPSKYSYAAGYAILSNYDIPAFYNTTEDHNKIILIFKENGFWDYVDSLSQNDDDKVLGLELIKRIKDFKIDDLDSKCKSRFKVFNTKLKSFNLEEYLEAMLQYAYG